MAKQTSSPIADAVTRRWLEYADQLVAVVRPLSEEQLDQRIAPNLRSAGEIVAHIITARGFWFEEVLKEQKKNAGWRSWPSGLSSPRRGSWGINWRAAWT